MIIFYMYFVTRISQLGEKIPFAIILVRVCLQIVRLAIVIKKTRESMKARNAEGEKLSVDEFGKGYDTFSKNDNEQNAKLNADVVEDSDLRGSDGHLGKNNLFGDFGKKMDKNKLINSGKDYLKAGDDDEENRELL